MHQADKPEQVFTDMEKLQKSSLNKTQEYETGHASCVDVSHSSDAALIQMIAARDQDALENLYHRYYRRLYWFISRITGRFDAAGETINDVMHVVWNSAGQFRPDTRPSRWIFGIACNAALKSLTCRGRLQSHEGEEPLDEKRTFDPNIWHQRLETKNGLLETMAQLSPQCRTTMELTYYYGMSYQEIADVMRCNENTVKRRMLYAQKAFE